MTGFKSLQTEVGLKMKFPFSRVNAVITRLLSKWQAPHVLLSALVRQAQLTVTRSNSWAKRCLTLERGASLNIDSSLNIWAQGDFGWLTKHLPRVLTMMRPKDPRDHSSLQGLGKATHGSHLQAAGLPFEPAEENPGGTQRQDSRCPIALSPLHHSPHLSRAQRCLPWWDHLHVGTALHPMLV